LYTNVVTVPDRIHRIDRDLAALRPLGIESKGGPLILIPSDGDYSRLKEILMEAVAIEPDGWSEKPLVMLHPGARYRFKAWPIERFAELADRLSEEHRCRVLIGGGEQDRATAQQIIDLAKSRPILLAGRLSLTEFAALATQCRLFVGNDNGAMHIAAAMGTPVVGLFGPSDPAEWGPHGEKVTVLYKGLDCRRCFHPTCFRGEENCMKQITVDEVYAAAERLLTEDSRLEHRGSPR
jgi:lipopolysaccharide heptosyltransferase II